jgi:hypothetical protein
MTFFCASLVQNRFALEERLRRSLRALLADDGHARTPCRHPAGSCDPGRDPHRLEEMVTRVVSELGVEGPAASLAEAAGSEAAHEAVQSLGILCRVGPEDRLGMLEAGLRGLVPGGVIVAVGADAHLLVAEGLLRRAGLSLICHERDRDGVEIVAAVRPSNTLVAI